jgi:hypothetical protein
MMISRQRFYIMIAIATLLLSALALGIFVPERAWKGIGGCVRAKTTRTWMTIFVHGSFGSLLGFLNFNDVLNDKLSGTLYRSLTKKMRMDEFFFKDQPMLQRGLVAFEPTLDREKAKGRFYAAFPIAQAYHAVDGMVHPVKPENHLFYAFGWSGLMSQTSRRYEAVRFYNAIQEELERLRLQGIRPKIRIIAHSHGGNLSLNLAAIDKVLRLKNFNEDQTLSQDHDEHESLQAMMAVFKLLLTKEDAKRKSDQKAYDYVPEKKSLCIDELYMLGAPIQPETESFAYNPFFKRVYNIYSTEDYVQQSDWVTTKKTFSTQRINKVPPHGQGKSARVMQLRITSSSAKLLKQSGPVIVQQDAKNSKKEPSIIEQFLGGKNIFVRQSSDPTHKELWMLSWIVDSSGHTTPISPLPSVILLPAVTKFFKRHPFIHDAELLLHIKPKKLQLEFIDKTSGRGIDTIRLSRTKLEVLQKKAMEWQVERTATGNDFEVIYKHLFN